MSPTASKKPPSKAPEPEYVLGVSDQETGRLGLQHRLWSESSHRLWELARIQPGMHVLDVGCGPGYAAVDLAELVGASGRVVGVDESPLFLKQLHDKAAARRLVHIDRVLGDVQQLDTLLAPAHEAFDAAYARWVLCFVPDPESVVRGVAKLLKPGGRFAVQDYFNYEAMTIAPRRPAFTRVIQAVGKSWRDRGGDPDIIGRFPALCRRHGLVVESMSVNHRVARPGTPIWHWPDSFWASYLPRLVEMGYLTPSDRSAFEAAWSEASTDPDTFMFLPPVYDVVAVKR
ncbi:MAG: class I SAM-dependent methyltransferase [Phycisphaerales bacterium]